MRSLSQIVSELEASRSVVQQELSRLDAAIAALQATRGFNRHQSANGSNGKPRRSLSAAARKRIAAAQRARWAALKAKQRKTA
jgi:hypothetical protein